MKLIAFMVCLFASVALSQNQGPDLRAEVANINYRGASNIDDYLLRCERVRALLPQIDVFYRQGEATIARHRIQDSNRPDLIKLADFYAGMNAKDQASLALLRQEMELALRMAKLSAQRRQVFFDQRIRPLQREEDLSSEQEIQMAVDARNRGVPLPQDILKAISNRK